MRFDAYAPRLGSMLTRPGSTAQLTTCVARAFDGMLSLHRPFGARSASDQLHVCLRALPSPFKFDSDCLGLRTGLVRREPEGARCCVRRRHLLLLDVARW